MISTSVGILDPTIHLKCLGGVFSSSSVSDSLTVSLSLELVLLFELFLSGVGDRVGGLDQLGVKIPDSVGWIRIGNPKSFNGEIGFVLGDPCGVSHGLSSRFFKIGEVMIGVVGGAFPFSLIIAQTLRPFLNVGLFDP